MKLNTYLLLISIRDWIEQPILQMAQKNYAPAILERDHLNMCVCEQIIQLEIGL